LPALRKSSIRSVVRGSVLFIRIRIHLTALQDSDFRIILNWKRNRFQNHLVLDDAEEPRSGTIAMITLLMRLRPTAAVLAGGLAVFTVWISWRAKALEIRMVKHDQSSELVNKPAPDFSLLSLDNRTVSLADYRGKKKIVLVFWASWCGPCRMELPLLRAFYERTHKTGSDFEFLAVSLDRDRESAATYAAEVTIPFPVLLDLSETAASAYQVQGIPLLFVIDQSGKVASAHVGVEPALDLMLAAALGLKDYTPSLGAPYGRRGN
jgi:peroxiredoxin